MDKKKFYITKKCITRGIIEKEFDFFDWEIRGDNLFIYKHVFNQKVLINQYTLGEWHTNKSEAIEMYIHKIDVEISAAERKIKRLLTKKESLQNEIQ